jgi:Cytochrome P450
LPQRAKDLHDQYGPIVRVAPNELSYVTASAWKEICGFRTGQSKNPKENPKDLAALSVAHNRQASPTAPFALVFCKALDELQPLILFYVDLLIQRLKDNAAQSQDMVAWYIWTTFDIIGDLITGESFHGLQDQYWHSWIEAIVEVLEAKVAVSTARRYGLDFLVQFLILKAVVEKFDRLFAYTKDKVGSRTERGTDRPDFMSYIMRNDKTGWQMSKAEIEANSDFLIVPEANQQLLFSQGRHTTFVSILRP